MRSRPAALALALLAACGSDPPAPAPSPDPSRPAASPSPTPRPAAAAFAGIAPALRSAGSAEVRVEMAVGTARPSYTARFTVLFRSGTYGAGVNPFARDRDIGFAVHRKPPDFLFNPPPWADPRPSAPPWMRLRASAGEATGKLIAEFDGFVASLSVPRCAPHVEWRGTDRIAATMVPGYSTETVTADRYEGVVPAAACVPAPPMLEDPLGSQAPVRIWIAADGRPIRYEADFEAETLRIGFDEFGTVDAIQPPGREEIRNR